MAYHVPTTEFEFEDGELKGLVVEFRHPSLDDYFDLVEAATAATEGDGLEPVRDLFRKVAAVGLVSWNLENGSGPVPATPENFTRHLTPLAGMVLVNRYLSEMGGLPGPLAVPSGAGTTSAKLPAKKPRSR